MEKKTKRIFIETTSNCNHNCTYCYYYKNIEKEKINKNQYISKEVIHKTCEHIAEAYDDFFVEAVLTGGEAFINKETLYYFIDQLRQTKNVKGIGINTNLTLLEEEDMPKLKDVGLFFSLVSLDKEIYEATTQGNFDVFMSKLKMIIKHKVPTVANIVVNSLNINDVLKTVAKAKMLGIKSIQLAYVHYTKKAKMYNSDIIDQDDMQKKGIRQFLSLIRELNKRYDGIYIGYPFQPCEMVMEEKDICLSCDCAEGIFSIGVNGDLKPCENNPFTRTFGNILDETKTVSQLINEMKEYKYTQTTPLPKECTECPMVQVCNSSCGPLTIKPKNLKMESYEDFKEYCALIKNNKEFGVNAKYMIEHLIPPWELYRFYIDDCQPLWDLSKKYEQ